MRIVIIRVYHFSPPHKLTRQRGIGIGDRRERNCPICTILVQSRPATRRKKVIQRYASGSRAGASLRKGVRTVFIAVDIFARDANGIHSDRNYVGCLNLLIKVFRTMIKAKADSILKDTRKKKRN
jgi:hypothetical protein